mmetsp:Transcript_7485/g.14637  ORF Transcript_7485/g.14637 Transcript_7485/m.14637 type:complete len:112 (-) Transcript_7485:232-567(-)
MGINITTNKRPPAATILEGEGRWPWYFPPGKTFRQEPLRRLSDRIVDYGISLCSVVLLRNILSLDRWQFNSPNVPLLMRLLPMFSLFDVGVLTSEHTRLVRRPSPPDSSQK